MFSDAGSIAFGLEKYVGAVPAVLFAAGADRRLRNRRCGCVAFHRVCGERLAGPASFVASQADRGKSIFAIYCGLIRWRRRWSHPGDAARPFDQRRPKPCRRTAAERYGVPAAVQRLGGPRTLGQRLPAQSVHRWVIVVLVLLSIILTASVLYPQIASGTIIAVLAAGSMIALVIYLAVPRAAPAELVNPSLRDTWRMPPLAELPPPAADDAQQGMVARIAGISRCRKPARPRPNPDARDGRSLTCRRFSLGLVRPCRVRLCTSWPI